MLCRVESREYKSFCVQPVYPLGKLFDHESGQLNLDLYSLDDNGNRPVLLPAELIQPLLCNDEGQSRSEFRKEVPFTSPRTQESCSKLKSHAEAHDDHDIRQLHSKAPSVSVSTTSWLPRYLVVLLDITIPIQYILDRVQLRPLSYVYRCRVYNPSRS